MNQNEQPLWLKPGAECWVENHGETLKMLYDAKQEAFFPAIIMQVIKTIKVKYLGSGLSNDEQLQKYIFQRDGRQGSVLVHTLDNLAELSVINEAEMLRHLKARFLQKKIFTSVGDALLITNPYQEIPELFSASVMKLYQNVVNLPELDSLPPHIYGIATSAFRDIFEGDRNQSIVISGESGSGKTESTKFALNVLTSLSNQASLKMSSHRQTIKGQAPLEQQILNCNPILESFGNAKTIRNDNSSRFGKLVTLLIGGSHQIEAAQFQSYLLEKSRVTQQTSDERNYHIFYAMLKGMHDKDLDALGLKPYNQKLDLSRFNYLRSNPKPIINSIDDASWYQQVQVSLAQLSFTAHEMNTIMSALAAILLLGNINFDEVSLTNDKPCTMDPPKLSVKVAQLLSVDLEMFEKALLFKTRNITTTQVIDSPLNRADCAAQRDSIAREVYDCLFQWLIRRINTIMVLLAQMTQSGQKRSKKLQILDIFGFEVLTHNSFEQMCINFANEKLQQLFIQTIFKKDQAELKAEGLGEYINQISFNDNQNIIDLLEGYPMGIFYLLDENSQIAGTDETMANKIRSQCSTHARFFAPPMGKTLFVIKHTPRDVEYDTLGFKAKNKDEVGKSLVDTLTHSTNPVVVDITNTKHGEDGTTTTTATTNKQKQKTLGGKFRASIKDLIDELSKSRLSFIRCLKPNEFRSKSDFVDIFVLQQLRYLGIADSIRVRREGFPYRKQYMEFYKKFGEMESNRYSFPKLVEMNANFKDLVTGMAIWKEVKMPNGQVGYLFGKTIIFLRLHTRDQIEEAYFKAVKRKHEMAARIQKGWFRYAQLKRLRLIRRGILRIQRMFRIRRQYRLFQDKRRSARFIQRWWRHILNERTRSYVRNHSIVVQKYLKRTACVKAYMHTSNALFLIQRFMHTKIRLIKRRKFQIFRGFFDRFIFDRFWYMIRRRAAVIIQRYARGFITRNIYAERVRHIVHFRRTYHKKRCLIVIQAFVRGLIVRKRLARMSRAARYIQGHMRSYWVSLLFMRLRLACIVIQRAFRKYRLGHGRLLTMLKQYLAHNEPKMTHYHHHQKQEFLKLQKQFCKAAIPTAGLVKTWVYPLLLSVETVTDMSDAFEPSFQSTLFEFIKARSQEGTTVMELRCGDAHMLASCSNQNLYTWGLNDFYQLGKMTKGETSHQLKHGQLITEPPIRANQTIITSGTRIKSITSGGNHNFCLNYNNELFAFGKNNHHEIGVPTPKNLPVPSQLTLGGVRNAYSHAIARGSRSLILTTKGGVYYNRVNQLQLVKLPTRTQIVQASLGIEYGVMLSANGIVYLLGNAPSPEPFNETHEMNPKHFHGEKVLQVESGMRHIIVRTGLGKVFTWGWGFKGQLGLGNLVTQHAPQLVQLPKWTKPVQVQAGPTSSVVLCESKKLYWWGTNGIISYQHHPEPISLDGIINSNENFPLKIEASWSRSVGIIYVKMADMSGISLPLSTKLKMCQQLASKWSETNMQQDVPYVESFAQYFGNDVMQSQHYSKDPTFRQAPLIEQLKQPTKGKPTVLHFEEHLQEQIFIDHFSKWEKPSLLKPRHVIVSDEDTLLSSNEVSPQKELERVKQRSKSPRFAGTTNEHNNIQMQRINLQPTTQGQPTHQGNQISHSQQQPPNPLHRPTQTQFQPSSPPTPTNTRQQPSQPQTQPSTPRLANKTPPIISKPPSQKSLEPPKLPQQPQQPQPPQQPQTRVQQPSRNSSQQRDKSPRLTFVNNGEPQEPVPWKDLHYTNEELWMMERLQRNLSNMKLRMENLLKIPKSKWTATDHQFMHSMFDQQIRSQLEQLK